MLLGLSLAINALSYLNFDPHYGFLRLKQEAIATGFYLPAYYAHVVLSSLILIVGFVQVVPSIRNRWRRLHRAFGIFYVFGILLFGAPGGLVMSLFIQRGPWVLASFLAQVTLWVYFTWMAYVKAKQRNFEAHAWWMWRSFSLTLAAITLRAYIFIASFYVDLSHPLGYSILAWMSWVPNLLMVEWYFYRRANINARPMV